MAVGAKEIAIFTAASELFTKKNTNCSIEESLERFKLVTQAAKDANIRVRGYVSTVVGCPYQGPIKPKKVAEVTESLLDLGCYEISLGDTIGVGNINSINEMLSEVLQVASPKQLAIHCHNTFGQALPNILVTLEKGIITIDSSVSGLGGCPYAHGASGNVATEDVLYMVHGLGAKTGIDLPEMVMVGRYICEQIGKKSDSKVTLALANAQRPKSINS